MHRLLFYIHYILLQTNSYSLHSVTPCTDTINMTASLVLRCVVECRSWRTSSRTRFFMGVRSPNKCPHPAASPETAAAVGLRNVYSPRRPLQPARAPAGNRAGRPSVRPVRRRSSDPCPPSAPTSPKRVCFRDSLFCSVSMFFTNYTRTHYL